MSLTPVSLCRRRSIPYSSGLRFEHVEKDCIELFSISLNPLFIRSQIRTFPEPPYVDTIAKVSIPYSSGLRFEHYKRRLSMNKIECLNPLFIRSQIRTQLASIFGADIMERSQSLIHQVSDSNLEKNGPASYCTSVSIPYSSGLRFERY